MPNISKISLEIRSNEPLNRNCFRLEMCGDGIPAFSPGQFVQLGIPGKFLKRPISVCDADGEHIVLIYKAVGEGTEILSGLSGGSRLELLAPLGRGFSAEACKRSALLTGGGLGSAPLLFLCKTLLGAGKKVNAVLCFNTAADVVLADEYKKLDVEPQIVTLDGSMGIKGYATDAVFPGHDFFYTCGPLPMMRAVCNTLPGPGQASMEERMGCGAGYCYGCTIKTADGPARVCADGPVFDKDKLLW
ncbi:MAG: dihydroorotate dehydrogenase electron transfer subunit [Bacteroidales bacterium]|nr:dihydroorotate dehydrogenase electron transfer subunit [Bacteroidales bacterium]